MGRPDGYRPWLIAVVLLPAVILGMSACSTTTAPPPTIADKGTPFGDLLVPKLTASVTNGVVGVAVDQPVTSTPKTVCSAP